MKRFTFCGIFFISTVIMFGQQTVKVKLNRRSQIENPAEANSGNSAQAVNGSLICTNGYIPGGTTNLNFAITTTNTDGEYIDSLSITFPAGFTINSTSANPSFPTSDNGGGDELLNGISGQTITWGSHINNTDNWGGIWADVTQYFTISVTATAISGTQTANFFAKGDEYASQIGNTNGDWNGNIIIPEAYANDFRVLDAWMPSGCNRTNAEPVNITITNNGSVAQFVFPLGYSVNGGANVNENYTDTINPGDTVTYTFNATTDLSAEGIYQLNAYANLAGDADTLNDSIVFQSETTVPMFPPYSSGFELSPLTDLLGWTTADVDSGGSTWSVVTALPHTGTNALRVIEINNGASEDWLFSRCFDFDQLNAYRLSWWSKLSSGSQGSFGVYIGTNNNITSMQNIYPLTSLGNPDVYVKDSVEFFVSASGTYYLGFQALQTDSNATITVSLDDINLIDLGPTIGIKNQDESEIRVFPNPTNETIYILSKAEGSSELYDLSGKQQMKTNLKRGINTLDISPLAEGIYILKIITEGGITYQKLTIIK